VLDWTQQQIWAIKYNAPSENIEGSFQLVLPDIEKVKTRVKKMNLVSLAEGFVFSIQSRLHSAEQTTSHKLFKLGMPFDR
jgi:hypothetical protein